MKIWIKEKIKEGLDEIKTREKGVWKSGMSHRIYQTSKNPNVLYKVGREVEVMEWSKLFKKFPKLFPKVYKVGRINSSDNVDDGWMYVEIEKLDTQRVEREWNLLEETLENMAVISDESLGSLEYYFQDAITDSDYEKEISKKVKQLAPNVYPIYVKWITFLKRLIHISEMTINREPDIHRYNFAYSADNTLKCIDI
jgi:hypothetical protein